MRFSKTLCILKISMPRNWHPYIIFAMVHGNRTSNHQTVARKFRPSFAFVWQYCLQADTTRTTDAQQWHVVGTSRADMKAAAIGRIFYIPQGQFEVSWPSRPYRANPESAKARPLNLRLKRLHFACIQRRYAYGDAPPWCCGTFPVIANSHWSRSRANMNTGRNFYEALGT